MTSLGLGDLTQFFQLRRDTFRVRSDLAQATQELSSGKTADLGRSVGGNHAPLVAIDRQISALGGWRTNAIEASLMADGAQLALGTLADTAGEMGTRLIAIETGHIGSLEEVMTNDARVAFEASVSALNSTVGGRSVFAGTATDTAALAPAGDMLDDIRLAVAGETTAAGVAAAVETWFGPGGGFETMGYVGAADTMTDVQISEGRRFGLDITADDGVLRDHLKGLAMAAMLSEPSLADLSEKERLAQLAGETILGNTSALVSKRAVLGASQASIEDAMAENSTAKAALEVARSDIVSVDPYEAATNLQNLEAQLQTIYTITARLSGLSLTNYLR